MSDDLWYIQEHVIPTAHVRGYARGLQNNYAGGLRLAVKQYTPRNYTTPKLGDITLIMVHGVGSAKELYEPLFDEIISNCRWPIRSIWATDAPYNGASYIMNKDLIGDEPNWFDNSRDLFQMINHFQGAMIPPLVGIGQSMGSTQLLHLSAFHPRLFSGLVLFEPGLGPNGRNKWPRPAKYHPGVLIAQRKDTWPSREEARKALAKSPHYRTFESRVFDRVIRYELADCPNTSPHSSSQIGTCDSIPVTLTTPKTMEAYMWMRAVPTLPGFPEGPGDKASLEAGAGMIPGFGRPEGLVAWRNLPYVYPPVLLIWGDLSELYGAAVEKNRLEITGVLGLGIGGGGGKKGGQVDEVTIVEARHAVPLEKPTECAEAVASWLDIKGKIWLDNFARKESDAPFDNSKIHREWLEMVSKL